MCVGIGRVLELLQNHRAGYFVSQLIGFLDSSFHALGSGGEFHTGSVSLHQVATLHAHAVGHGQDEVIAFHGRYEGQTYAGVTAGRFDDGGSGLQDALPLGALDHGEGHTVFHAAGRIEIFQLGDDAGREFILLGIRFEFEEGRVTD